LKSRNLNLKGRLDIEFTACYGELMPEEALTPFTVFDAYRYSLRVRHSY